VGGGNPAMPAFQKYAVANTFLFEAGYEYDENII